MLNLLLPDPGDGSVETTGSLRETLACAAVMIFGAGFLALASGWVL